MTQLLGAAKNALHHARGSRAADDDDAQMLAEFYATVGGRPTTAEVAHVRRQFAKGAFPSKGVRSTTR